MGTQIVIKVQPNSRLIDVQEQFNQYFPFLKLEFYETTDLKRGRSSKPALSPSTQMHIRYNGKAVHELTLSESMTVAELEQKIKEELGLNAEVLRKSGNVWLETNLTSNWTLQQQNTMGLTIS